MKEWQVAIVAGVVTGLLLRIAWEAVGINYRTHAILVILRDHARTAAEESAAPPLSSSPVPTGSPVAPTTPTQEASS